jgi:hypothetical protein
MYLEAEIKVTERYIWRPRLSKHRDAFGAND